VTDDAEAFGNHTWIDGHAAVPSAIAVRQTAIT
jgi:hypothetical protein